MLKKQLYISLLIFTLLIINFSTAQETNTTKIDTAPTEPAEPEQNISQGSDVVSNDEIGEIDQIIGNTKDDGKKPQTPLPVKKENFPEAKVILPIRRIETSAGAMDTAPCGGIVKKNADTITNKGSNIHVIWETITAAQNGNCTVKLAPGPDEAKEKDFVPLMPTSTKANANGTFPCGRVKGFEAQEFDLPDDYVCDRCILQWSWTTPVGTFYSCSDLIINGAKIKECMGRCKNGGSCFNGECICTDNYYGKFCETNSKLFYVN
jgi:hypothetical protein